MSGLLHTAKTTSSQSANLSLQDSVVMVRDLFRDRDQTEFIIATIPTVLGINESRRLLAALRKESIPCRRIIINQVCLILGMQICHASNMMPSHSQQK